MKTLLSAVLGLMAMTGIAAAEPLRLSDTQMDGLYAGRQDNHPGRDFGQSLGRGSSGRAGPVINITNIFQISIATSIAIGVNLGSGTTTVSSSAIASNVAFVSQRNSFRR